MTGTLDETVDLIVVGFGAAGAAAALTAADVGARVLVLEKQAQEAHSPSTRMSGGVIMGVDDVERATRYLDRCAGGLIPTDVTRAWAQWAHEVFDWLRGAGVDVTYRPEGFGEHPTIDGYDAVRFWRHATLRDGSPVSEEYRGSAAQLALGDAQAVRAQGRSLARSGTDLWDALAAAVADRRTVEVRWESPARRLLTDETGRVVGVEHGLGDGARTYARHGVVLACGGFEFDDGMKENFLRLRPVHFYGNRANTGDGVRLAQAVGADLWHMNTFVGRGVGHFELDGEPMNFIMHLRPGGYVITDSEGRRFTDESNQAALRHDFWNEFLYYDSRLRRYPRVPAYWIFDSRRMDHGPLTSKVLGLVGIGRYDWSDSNEAEVDRGWIVRGATVREAAERAGIGDPGRAEQEVAEYNAACESGLDRLGRPRESLVPLDQAPYYCVPLYPGGSNTSGGPRRDASARILDPYGAPIPGLFGAGELGQAIGELYPADGCNLSEALSFGRIAARSAVGGSALRDTTSDG